MECMSSTPPIYSLPYELLISIFEGFSSRELLHWTSVSSQFYNVICHILACRFAAIKRLGDRYTLRLDCYLPSRVASRGATIGTYLDTKPLPRDPSEHPKDLDGLLLLKQGFSIGDLGVLGEQYTRFKVMQQLESRNLPEWKVFTIDDQSDGNAEGIADRSSPYGDGQERSSDSRVMPFRIFLDSAEPFAQVCVTAKLLGEGLSAGVNISKGVVRLWRDWLAEQPVCGSSMPFTDASTLESDASYAQDHSLSKKDVMWVDTSLESGLRLHMHSVQQVGGCCLQEITDSAETMVYYMLEVDEFVIRSGRLLFAIEEAKEIVENGSQRAVVWRINHYLDVAA